jgi:hypothetical protein
MKIAVIGTANIGKSTYIKDFLKKWPMYKLVDSEYRKLLKEKNLSHSKDGNEESQRIILNCLVDEVVKYSKDEFAIFDRCVVDVLAYSTWLHLNGKISEKFLDEQRILIRETLKLYDVLFFIPLTKVAPVEIDDNGIRETDPVYREEIDTIFKAFQESYHRGDGRVFPKDDCPAIIEIFGNPEQRLKMTELYLTQEGKCYGEEESLISDIIPAKF